MINFPIWSDLGDTLVGQQSKNLWEAHLARLETYRTYFEGDIFEEVQPAEVGSDDSDIKLFPVGLNIVKMVCLSLADSLWGEWDERPFRLTIKDGEEVGEADEKAIAILNDLIDQAGANMFWEMGLDREKYGGSIFKVTPQPGRKHGLAWYRVPAERFFAIASPVDPDDIFEAFLITNMSRQQIKYLYGVDAEDDYQTVVEHWTKEKYETRVGKDIVVSKYSGKNSWGVVPFVYIPRVRSSSNWFGDALTMDLMDPQDEINMRVADIGEGINYNFHPTRWGRNLPRGFNATNFPIGPNSFWDMGRAIGSDNPEVGILEARNSYGELAVKHVEFLYDWTRTSSFAPPIAFGEDDGGGQRSGITLEIRMWPLLKAMKRNRSYIMSGLIRLISLTAKILDHKQYKDIPKEAIVSMLEGRIVPSFYPVMPRDHTAAVDEVVKLRSTNPPMISIPTAQEALGRGPAEVALVEKEAEELRERAEEIANNFNENQPDEEGNEGSVSDG